MELWQKYKDLVYLATIIFGVIFYFRDEASEKATTEVILIEVQKDVAEIKENQRVKYLEYDRRWEESIKADANITALLGGNVNTSSGSTEEGQ